jgi:hypothetical protein
METEHTPETEQRNRCTKAQLQERQEKACDLLAEGWPSHAVVKQLSTDYNVTEQQARDYVRCGRQLLIEAVGVEDRAAMFAQVLTNLQLDRMEARQAGNSSAAVGASKAMVQLLRQLGEIDPMRDFERAFMEAAAVKPPKMDKIPRVSINTKLDPEYPF